jgi:hypothetical protein
VLNDGIVVPPVDTIAVIVGPAAPAMAGPLADPCPLAPWQPEQFVVYIWAGLGAGVVTVSTLDAAELPAELKAKTL